MLQDWKLQVSALLLLVILSVSQASPARVANAYNFILPPEAGKTSASRTIINAQVPRAPSFFRNVQQQQQQQQETTASQVTQQVQGPSEWPAESSDGQPVSQQKIEIGSEANLVQQQLQAREEESQRREEQERIPLETVSSSADGQVKEEQQQQQQQQQSSQINSHFGGFGQRKSRPRPLLVPQAAVIRQEQVPLLPQAETNVRIEQQQIQQSSVQQEIKGVPSSQASTVTVQQKVEEPAESNPALESFLRGTSSQGSVSLPPLPPPPQQAVVVQQTEAPLTIPAPPSTTTITFLQPSNVQQQVQPARAAESSAQVQFSQSFGSIGQVQEQSQVQESIGQVQESVGQTQQQKIQASSEDVQTQAQPSVQVVQQQQQQQFQNIYYQPPEAEVRQIVQIRQPELPTDQRPVVDASSVQITQEREQTQQQSQEQQQVILQEPPRAESTGSAQVQSQVVLGDVQQKEEQQVQQQQFSLPSQPQVREVSVPEESRILGPSPPPQPENTLVQPGQEPPREIRKQFNLIEQDPNKQSITFTKVTVTDTLLPDIQNGEQPPTPTVQPNVQVDYLNQVNPQVNQAQVQPQFLVRQVPTQAPQQQQQQQINLQQNVQPQQLFLLRPVQQGPQLQQQFGGQLFFINNGQNGGALTNQQLILSPVQGPPQAQGITYFLQPQQPQQILQLAPQQPQQRLPETLLQLQPQPQPPQQTFVQFQSQPQPQPPQQTFVQFQSQPQPQPQPPPQSFVQIQPQQPQPQLVQPELSPIQNQVSVSDVSNTIPTPPPQPPQVIYTEVTRQTEQTPPPQPPLVTLTQVTRQTELVTPPPPTTVGVEYMEEDNVQVKERSQQETKGQVQPKEESRESSQAVDIPQVKEQAVKGDIVPEAPSASQLAISRPKIPERPPPLPQAVKGSEPRPQQVRIPEESTKSVRRPAPTIPEGRKVRQPLAPLLPRRPESTKSASQTIQIKEIGESAPPQEEVDFQRFPDLMASGHLQEDLLRINKPVSAEKTLSSNRSPVPPQRLVPVKTRAPQSPGSVLRDIRVNHEAPTTEMYADRTLDESAGKQRVYRVSSPSTIRIPSIEVVTQSNADDGFGDEQRRVPVDSEESRKVQLPLPAVKAPLRVTRRPEVVEQIRESLSSANLQPVIQSRLQSPDELQFRPQYLSSLSSEVSSGNYGAQEAPAKRLRRVQRPRRYRLNAASGQRFGSLNEATRALAAQQRAGGRHRRRRPVASEN